MLNKDVFKSGIEKLVFEYGDKGFTMSKEKAGQWLEYMKQWDEETFDNAIDTCLTTCS